ncbi:MAG: hypothetical protein WAU70_08730 [Flavobacteriales bacterium]
MMPTFAVVLAVGMAVVGVFAFPVGLLLTAICLIVGLMRTGAEIDLPGRRVRHYIWILGNRSGKWNTLDQYACLSVLRGRRTSTTFSRSQQSVTTEEITYDVYLLSGTHRRKFLLALNPTKSEAEELSAKLSQTLALPIERYSPQPISRTVRR